MGASVCHRHSGSKCKPSRVLFQHNADTKSPMNMGGCRRIMVSVCSRVAVFRSKRAEAHVQIRLVEIMVSQRAKAHYGPAPTGASRKRPDIRAQSYFKTNYGVFANEDKPCTAVQRPAQQLPAHISLPQLKPLQVLPMRSNVVMWTAQCQGNVARAISNSWEARPAGFGWPCRSASPL